MPNISKAIYTIGQSACDLNKCLKGVVIKYGTHWGRRDSV